MLIHDCAPGIDDAFACATLVGLRRAPDAVVAVAVASNVGIYDVSRNAAGLVALLGLDIPVIRDAATGVARPFPEGAPHVHGGDGLGGGAKFLPAGAYDQLPVDLGFWRGDVLATGPLTNVANARGRQAPINSVTWMGGTLRAGGNIVDFAEFNAYCDPEAAEVVLSSGTACSIIPLDVTTSVPLTIYDVKRLEAVGPVAAAFVAADRFLQAANEQGEYAYLHDAVAAVALVNPGLFTWEQHTLACDTSNGERRGETTALVRGSGRRSVNVAVEVDVEAVHDLIMTAVLTAVAAR